ncbi:MAG: hypothetical protein JXR22_08460 [Prolixibacteraceae bacterium]|nr:hypothetical protein [Prolixibacteraceae bacterium]
MKQSIQQTLVLILFLSLCMFSACKRKNVPAETLFFDLETSKGANWCITGIDELRKGDILVIANGNFLPETVELTSGILFGHAAMVTKGYQHTNIDTLLANSTIIELTGLHIHPEFQLREISALTDHPFAGLRSDSFSNKRTGLRYRLRLNISEEQADQLVAFARAQLGEDYSWNAMKQFRDERKLNEDSDFSWADNSVWSCTLLIWQAVYSVTGLDIDFNKGFFVYSNDMIVHPAFDNSGDHVGRARF